MAGINLKFFNNENGYSDGEVENTILKIVKGEIIPDWSNYAVSYHLSHLRENILNWYPFPKGASVLEVGAGCGAITGLLCDRFETVTSVELTKRRAEIIFERYHNRDNLEIFVGNFGSMEFVHKFDYIVVNGVFEYAISFTSGENPYSDFLELIKKQLKPQGKILLAIENRIGMKYISGAREDHTGHFFSGINDYPDTDFVRTFSKEELAAIIEKCGFSYHFYYPYPDYKFPDEIFTDDSILEMNYGKPYNLLDADGLQLFNEPLMNKTLISENSASVFSNSFLVELFETDDRKDNWKPYYVKISADRKDRFRIHTSILQKDKEKKVIKGALTKKAEAHIHKIFLNSQQQIGSTFRYLKGKKTPLGVEFPFLKWKTFDVMIVEQIKRGNRESFLLLLDLFWKELFSESVDSEYLTDKFCYYFGQETLEAKMKVAAYSNVDILLDNIFFLEEKKGYIIIDPEWILDIPVPALFVFWRSVNELYSRENRLNKFFPKTDIMKHFSIREKEEKVFTAWISHFSEHYVGSGYLNSLIKIRYEVNLEKELLLQKEKKRFSPRLFYDTGRFFNEEEVIEKHVAIMEDGSFSVKYDLPKEKHIRNIRWDPVEMRLFGCTIEKVDSNISIRIFPENATSTEQGKAIFLRKDPIYAFSGEIHLAQFIEIQGKVLSLTEEDKINAFETYDKKMLEKIGVLQQNINFVSEEKDKIVFQKEEEISQQKTALKMSDVILKEKQRLIEEQELILHKKQNEIIIQESVIKGKAIQNDELILENQNKALKNDELIQWIKELEDHPLKNVLRTIKRKIKK